MTPPRPAPTERPRVFGILRPTPAVGVIAFFKLGLLLFCGSAYGYYRDELYTLACAHRLAWGYVDHPPLSIAVLSVTSKLYGETLLSMRLVPAITGALVILLTARLAKRFGASTMAQGIAALSVLATPQLLALDHTYSADSLDVLFWVASIGLVARAITADPEDKVLPWVRVGVVLGLGTLNKVTMVGFAGALLVGIAATPHRALFRRGGPWLALGVAAVLIAPYLSWQRAHGWVLLDFLGRTQAGYGTAWEQLFAIGPWNALVLGLGLWALFRAPQLATYQPLALLVSIWIMTWVLSGGQTWSLAPVCPLLFAAGAMALDSWLRARRWRAPALALTLLVFSALTAPFFIPILRIARFEEYARTFALLPRSTSADDSPLPVRFADMYGWPELVRAVAGVATTLLPLDRDDAVVLASNAGEAGALEAFGAAVGLPPVISGHDQYYLWGTGGGSGDVVIAVGGDEALLRASFRSVEVATVFGHSRATPAERHIKVYVCRGSVEPLDVMWPRFKHFD